MKIYNSLTAKLEEFKPLKAGEVTMYVCGPTVYDHAHIGNARPIVVFDTLARVFKEDGYTVKFASNYTDVDDKIIKRAQEDNISEEEVATTYIKAYQDIREKLNAIDLTDTPKVTETMQDIISFINQLIEEGYAYVVDEDVYFRVSKVKNYGQLSKQKLEDLVVGARIEENSKKENPLDFTLWKQTDVGIKWDTPWGVGRPGWHTECVVMINKVFNSHKIDIHGGGMDLKFPHHENEIAQSNALYHNNIANYWFHNGLLVFDGDKMSKSLGNVLWAKDVIKELGTNVTRWVLLSGHYRGPLKFSEEVIEGAKVELERVIHTLDLVHVQAQLENITFNDELEPTSYQNFMEAMRNDLNTPNAYKEIFNSVKKLNQGLRSKDIDWKMMTATTNSVERMLEVLGLEYNYPKVTDEDKEIFKNWQEAKDEKDFLKADEYRALLLERKLI